MDLHFVRELRRTLRPSQDAPLAVGQVGAELVNDFAREWNTYAALPHWLQAGDPLMKLLEEAAPQPVIARMRHSYEKRDPVALERTRTQYDILQRSLARLAKATALTAGMPTVRSCFVPQPVVGRTPSELRAYIEGTDPILKQPFMKGVLDGLFGEATYAPEQFRMSLLVGIGVSNGGLFWSRHANSRLEIGFPCTATMQVSSVWSAIATLRGPLC